MSSANMQKVAPSEEPIDDGANNTRSPGDGTNNNSPEERVAVPQDPAFATGKSQDGRGGSSPGPPGGPNSNTVGDEEESRRPPTKEEEVVLGSPEPPVASPVHPATGSKDAFPPEEEPLSFSVPPLTGTMAKEERRPPEERGENDENIKRVSGSGNEINDHESPNSAGSGKAAWGKAITTVVLENTLAEGGDTNTSPSNNPNGNNLGQTSTTNKKKSRLANLNQSLFGGGAPQLSSPQHSKQSDSSKNTDSNRLMKKWAAATKATQVAKGNLDETRRTRAGNALANEGWTAFLSGAGALGDGRAEAQMMISQKLKKAEEEMRDISLEERKLFNQTWRDQRGFGTFWSKIPILHPNSRLSLGWQIAMVPPLLYIASILPYRLTFHEFRVRSHTESDDQYKDPSFWVPFDILVDILFWMDLCLMFITAYFDKNGLLKSDPRDVASNYLKTWFAIDFIACLPPEAFGAGNSNKTGRLAKLYRLFRIFKLVRLRKVSHLREAFLRVKQTPPVAMIYATLGERTPAILTFTFATSMLAHLCACGFYMCASFHNADREETWVWQDRVDDPNVQPLVERPPAAHWNRSLFFIFTVFTTVGFGNVAPFTPVETTFTIFLMLIGACVNAIVVSEVLGVVSKQNAVEKDLRSMRQTIGAYLARLGVQNAIYEDKLMATAEVHTRNKYSDMEGRPMKDLPTQDWEGFFKVCAQSPPHVFEPIILKAHHGLIGKSAFCRALHMDPTDAKCVIFLTFLERCFFPPNELLWEVGDQAEYLYILSAGTVSYIALCHEVHGGIPGTGISRRFGFPMYPYVLFGDRNYVGEHEMLFPSTRLRQTTCRAETWIEAFRMSRTNFYLLSTYYSQGFENLKIQAMQREQRRLYYLKMLKQPQAVDDVAATRMQLQFRMLMKNRTVLRNREKLRNSSSGQKKDFFSEEHGGAKEDSEVAPPEKGRAPEGSNQTGSRRRSAVSCQELGVEPQKTPTGNFSVQGSESELSEVKRVEQKVEKMRIDIDKRHHEQMRLLQLIVHCTAKKEGDNEKS